MAKAKVTVKRTGGRKLEKFLKEAGRGGVSGVAVGFFSDARYDDQKGTPVAAVAAWNEFGTKNIPERPFFRQAIAAMEDGIANIVKAGIDPQRMVVDDRLADTVGAYAAGQVQESITNLRDPSSADSTVATKRKKLHGKKGAKAISPSNPLIDTGFMRDSVGWSVDGGPTQYQ